MAEHEGSVLQTAWRFTKLGAGGVLVLFALFLMRPSSDYIQQMERLEYEGRIVTAKVIGKIEGSSSPRTSLPPRGGGAAGAAARGFVAGKRLGELADGRGDDQFYLEFQFTTPKGERIEDRGVVSAADFKRIAAGAELDVIYLPENPTINRLIAYTEPFKRIPKSILLTVSFIVGSIGAFLIWRNWPFGAVVAAGGGDRDPLDRIRGDSRFTRPVVSNGELPVRRGQPQPARRRQGFGQRA